jgi:hypothetical protein
MKNIKYIFMIAGLVLMTSCFEDPGTDITWEGGSFVELDAASTQTGARNYSYLRLNNGTTYSSGMNVLRVSSSSKEAVTVNFTIDASSTAIEGVHYTVSGSTATIAAGEFLAELPITILADNIEAGESWSIDVTITDASIDVGARSSATHNVAIACPSDLAGTYTFVTNNGFTGPGGPGCCFDGITGSGTITATPTGGTYTITDATFGVFPDLWNDSPASGPLLKDVCDQISFSGGDQYGDTYAILSAITRSVDGTSITFDWENTYGDGGTTTITLDSGTWPAAINSGI